jgi:hypothetical protein
MKDNLNTLVKGFLNWNIALVLLFETIIWILVKNVDINFSGLHKVYLLILAYLCLLISSKKWFVYSLFLSIPFFISSFFSESIFSFIESISEAIRLTILFPIGFYLYSENKKGNLDSKFFYNFIWISFYIISANLILGYFGFGNAQRAGGLGTRGFFNAGNDISTLTCIIAAFVLSFTWGKSKIKFFGYLIYFFFLAFLLNTKASIVGLVMITVLLIYFPTIKNVVTKSIVKIRDLKMVFINGFLIVLLFGIALLYSIKSNFWDRYLTFYNQFKNDSILTFLLSRRDVFVKNGLDFSNENFSFLNYIFGYGTGDFLMELGKRAEIDPFDLFFFYGIIGVILIYYLFLKMIYKSLKCKDYPVDKLQLNRGLFASNVFLLFTSITAGHVFTSVIICIFLGVTNAMGKTNS